MKIIPWVVLLAGLLLSGYANAQTVVADLDSAYEYYKNVSPISGNSAPTPPPQRMPQTTTQNNTNNLPGIGGLANNLMGPVEIVAGFLSAMSIATGIACLFGAFVRYMQHRVNPLAHPISIVITLFILGVILVLLPLIYKFTESGIPVFLG